MVKTWLLQVAASLFEQLKPLLIEQIRSILPELVSAVKAELPELTRAVAAEVEKQMPTIIHAVIVAITTTLADAATRGVDKVTDLVPGTLDDQIIDPIVQQIRDRLGGILG